MNEKFLLIANCAGIGASIFGFVLILWHLWRGVPVEPQQRQSQVKKTILMAIIFIFLLSFLSFRLRSVVDVYEQVGSFKTYRTGTNEIFYPAPYKSPPKLEFEDKRTHPGNTSGPIILEQRRDGFKVIIDEYSWAYDWNALGTKAE